MLPDSSDGFHRTGQAIYLTFSKHLFSYHFYHFCGHLFPEYLVVFYK